MKTLTAQTMQTQTPQTPATATVCLMSSPGTFGSGELKNIIARMTTKILTTESTSALTLMRPTNILNFQFLRSESINL